ncbi:MAG: lysophospholipid acyltransferase family protein [Chloroflexota bacterium]
MKRNEILYWVLRLGGKIAPRVPVSLAYRLADLVGAAAFALAGEQRTALLGNLGVALGETRTEAEIAGIARRAFENNARNWVDTMRINSLSRDQLGEMIHVEGWEHLTAALEAGRGVVMVSLHLGNFDLVGQILTIHDIHLTVPIERMKPERLFDLLVEDRATRGVTMIAVDEAPRSLLKALRKGEVVGVMADGNVAGERVHVDLFGLPVALPRAPAQLARATGAAVVVAVGTRLSNGRFVGHISPAVPIVHGQDIEQDHAENTQRIAIELERFIRCFPEQWMAFTPFWGQVEQPADRINHRTEARI